MYCYAVERDGSIGPLSRQTQPLQEGIGPLVGVAGDSFPFFRIIRSFEVGDELRSKRLERGKVLRNLGESFPNQTMGQVGPELLHKGFDPTRIGEKAVVNIPGVISADISFSTFAENHIFSEI